MLYLLYHALAVNAVQLYHAKQNTAAGNEVGGLNLTCSICSARGFKDQKALDQHCRTRHGIRNPVVQFVGSILKCPVCSTEFHTRLRLITHLSDKRVRSKVRGVSCRDAFLRSGPEPVSPDALAELNRVNDAMRAKAMKEGHTHPICVRSALRTSACILEGLSNGSSKAFKRILLPIKRCMQKSDPTTHTAANSKFVSVRRLVPCRRICVKSSPSFGKCRLK